MVDKQALKQKYQTLAKKIFEGNTIQGFAKWKSTHYKFIAPAKKEYVYQWFWDTAFHAIVLSNFDLPWAKSEIKNHLSAQWDDGFIPHIVFWGGNYLNLPHWAFIESRFNFRPRTSALTQPSVFPIAVEIIYNKDKDKDFLKETLFKLAKHQKWLLENRDPDKDYLISIISPNESGMDELPVFQYALNYTGENAARLHYTHRKVDLLNHLFRFNNKKILYRDYFNVEEMLFNTIYIEANRSLSRLFKEIDEENESEYFSNLANKGEVSLLEKCWDEKDQIFYSLFSKSEKMARVKTVASLMPIFLDGIDKSRLNQLVKFHLLNPNEFWRPFPIPSVAADETYYFPADTPAHKIKLLWRGPTWINTNWFIVRGLRKHGYNKIADQIVENMINMVEKWGFREYYNPETGQGYRRENFGWSTLLLDLL